MPDITTESEAVAALEDWHDSTKHGPVWNTDSMSPELVADLWLAWLVRQGVELEHHRFDHKGPIAPEWRVDYRGRSVTATSPLVAAARAFLENRNG